MLYRMYKPTRIVHPGGYRCTRMVHHGVHLASSHLLVPESDMDIELQNQMVLLSPNKTIHVLVTR